MLHSGAQTSTYRKRGSFISKLTKLSYLPACQLGRDWLRLKFQRKISLRKCIRILQLYVIRTMQSFGRARAKVVKSLNLHGRQSLYFLLFLVRNFDVAGQLFVSFPPVSTFDCDDCIAVHQTECLHDGDNFPGPLYTLEGPDPFFLFRIYHMLIVADDSLQESSLYVQGTLGDGSVLNFHRRIHTINYNHQCTNSHSNITFRSLTRISTSN
jgi:hypothetical protein